MKRRVFISYRRADAIHLAARIKQRIEATYRDSEVFLDVDTMPIVTNYVTHVQEQVRASDLLLALLTPGWAGPIGVDGRRRIDDPSDVVRVEIGAALNAGIPVVPVAADGASFPRQEDLPSDLSALALHSGIELRGTTFDADMDLLLDRLTPLIRRGAVAFVTGRQQDRRRRWFVPSEGKSEWFSDIDGGPQLVVVPAGRFTMGSPVDEPGREPEDTGSESQIEQVVPRPFTIGRAPVTVDQFSKFISATGKEPPAGAYRWSETKDDYSLAKGRSWRDLSGDHPVVCISWADAVAYLAWLSDTTGWHYRLPSCAEWEYAARAGTTASFHWGATISPRQANYDARTPYRGGGERGEASRGPVPVLSFEPNVWGLYQVHGNVWEMCQEQWPEDASLRMCCGGSFEDGPEYLRSAMRSDVLEHDRYVSVGFRVVRDIG